MNFHPLEIKDVISLTDDAKQIVFNVPALIKNKFERKAGQFVSLKLNINGSEVRRDYSICTDSTFGDSFGIGVKRVEGGLVSNFVNNEFKTGDTIEVSEPQGRFTYDVSSKQLVLIAAGSGITPILSILKQALSDNSTEQIQLLYSSKSAEKCMFINEIIEIADNNPKLHVTFFFSRDKKEVGGGNNVSYREGRIHESFIQKQLEGNVFDQYANYFICGPEDLILRSQKFLEKNFVRQENIHFELFTAPTKKSDSSSTSVAEGKAMLKASLDGIEVEIEADKSKYILDQLMETELDPPFSCQGGVCGACMCTVTSGEVDMEDNFTLTTDEIEEGKILACISRAKSDEVVIEYE